MTLLEQMREIVENADKLATYKQTVDNQAKHIAFLESNMKKLERRLLVSKQADSRSLDKYVVDNNEELWRTL